MREKILFNDNWLFHEGDINTGTPSFKGPVYMQSKTEHKIWGPASRNYNAVYDDYNAANQIRTERWERVSLPHDYVIFQEPKEKNNNALGFFEYNNAWYRKKLTLCEDDKTYALRLIQDNATSCANGADIAVITCFCVDENDIEVPTASPYVSFCTNGLGTVVGTGSSVSDHTPVNLSERRMYAGKITVAVRVGNKKGTLRVFASADNLNDASLDIELNS